MVEMENEEANPLEEKKLKKKSYVQKIYYVLFLIVERTHTA